ncbi:MAG: hypothetical protein AB7S38_18585 [Vulcanimicrobiota bacterium]
MKVNKRRGISLILALFTTVVLLTLSIAFIALALGEARTSRSASYAVVASNTANWGIEFTLNYMGRGGNWSTQFSPLDFTVFEVLNAAQPNGQVHLTGPDGNLSATVTVPATGDPNTRLVTITGPGPGGAPVVVGSGSEQLLGQVEVEVTPIKVTGIAGQQPQFQLISRARVTRPGGEQVASRVIEARVRQKPETSDLMHIQNLRSWDAQGAGVGNPEMADKILVPRSFKADGTVRITGTDPAVPGAPWATQSGNVRLENPDSQNLAFEGPLFINRLGNLGPTGNSFLQPDLAAYQGGVFFGSDFVPLPDVSFYLNRDKDGNGSVNQAGTINNFDLANAGEERGLLYAASIDTNGDPVPQGQLVSGYYPVNRTLVEAGHQAHPRLPDASASLPVTLQDYRPPTPEVEIVLMDGGMIQVNYWETNFGDGGISNTDGSLNSVGASQGNVGRVGQPFHISQLKHGTIYVEGGNAVVRSELSGGEASEFEGRLQIVAAEDASRRPIAGANPPAYNNVAGSIYNQAAREFFNYQKTLVELPSDDPNYVPPENFHAPPYTGAELRAAAASGIVTSPVNGLPNDGTVYWPPPAATVDREGNLVVAGDIKKSQNTNSVIGLSAENFVLLNDRTAGLKQNPKELVVDAVLMSFEHSVQLDWDNTGNNRVKVGNNDLHDVLVAPGFNGKFVYQGSLISAFSDVEGDVNGKGYPDQDLTHDRDLLNVTPPFQPRALLANYPNEQISIEWQIKQYVDRGSLNTYLTN